MKKIILAATLVLGMSLPAVAAAPRLVVDNFKFDFGQVYQGVRVDHIYRFQNIGDATLNIKKVRSSCGCTAALLSADQLAPGEAGEVKVSFDSSRFKGEVTKTVYLYTDDPDHREVYLNLRGEVLARIVSDPAQLMLENLSPGVERTATVVIANRSQDPLELEPPTSSIVDLKASLASSSLAPGESTQMTVTVLPKDGANRFSGYIFVRVSGPQATELRIPVQAAVH